MPAGPDSAFWTVKNKRNATKKTIQEYFRKLKFFSNNAFSFINVHNERLFNKNAKVLVEIVQMWQNLRLKTREQNQFLGDKYLIKSSLTFSKNLTACICSLTDYEMSKNFW